VNSGQLVGIVDINQTGKSTAKAFAFDCCRTLDDDANIAAHNMAYCIRQRGARVRAYNGTRGMAFAARRQRVRAPLYACDGSIIVFALPPAYYYAHTRYTHPCYARRLYQRRAPRVHCRSIRCAAQQARYARFGGTTLPFCDWHCRTGADA